MKEAWLEEPPNRQWCMEEMGSDTAIKETELSTSDKGVLNIRRPVIIIIRAKAVESKDVSGTILGTKIIGE